MNALLLVLNTFGRQTIINSTLWNQLNAMSILTQKKKEETRGGKLNIMLARYFERHLGPTPSGPVHQMGLLLQSLCSSSDPCWWEKTLFTLGWN